jgi:hypothetical protein
MSALLIPKWLLRRFKNTFNATVKVANGDRWISPGGTGHWHSIDLGSDH